jgi:hypothetical protein
MSEEPPLRYVVLRHEGVPEPHFDLMWEWRPGSALMTVRCAEWPLRNPRKFERLPDHRPFYLTYEGEVSDNRGYVRRVASGTCTFEVDREDASVVRLDTGLTLRVPRAQWD